MENLNKYTISLTLFLGIVIFACSNYDSELPSPEPVSTTAQDAAPAQNSAERLTLINVPSDPKTQYFSLGKAWSSQVEVVLVTKRVSSVETSYASRHYNCTDRTFRYLAESDTLEGLESQKGHQDSMSRLTPGSISDDVANFACVK